jgi:hypothetical protein
MPPVLVGACLWYRRWDRPGRIWPSCRTRWGIGPRSKLLAINLRMEKLRGSYDKSFYVGRSKRMGGHSCFLRHCWRAKCWFQIRRDKLVARRATLSLPIPAREPCLITYRHMKEENRVWTRRKSQPCRDHMGFHKERTRKIVSWSEVARLSNFGLAEPRNTNPPSTVCLKVALMWFACHSIGNPPFRIWGIQHLPLTGIPKWSQ